MESGSGENRNITTLIKDFCGNILTHADFLDLEKGQEYIDSLKDDEKRLLYEVSNGEKREDIRSIVINCIQNYVASYSGISSLYTPFAFDNSHNFQDYHNGFIDYYKKGNNGATLPKAIDYAFDCIKDASESYRFFESFFVSRKDDIVKEVDENLKGAVKEKVDAELKKRIATRIAVATKEATIQAGLAAKSAEESAGNAAKAANDQVEKAVKDKMTEVTKTISETSVTILGIFSGIVLTIVAGLFYSSSVLNNINSANFLRLICVSSLVGFVCVNLIFALFHFVEKIRFPNASESSSSSLSKASKIDIVVSGILFLIMIITGFIHFIFPDIGSFSNNTNSNTIISEDINEKIDESDGLVESVEPGTIEQSKSAELNEPNKSN